jgi:hypothetical protein
MTALYSTLLPDSKIKRYRVIIHVAEATGPLAMTHDMQRSLIRAASATLDELERTRQLLSEVAPDLVRRFA